MTSRRFFYRTMRALAAAAVLVLAVAACGSGDEAKHTAGPKVQPPPGGHPLARLGPAETRLDLVAPPGYAEDGSADPQADWVSDFETQTGCQVTIRTAHTPEDVVTLLRTGRYDGAAAPSDVMLQLIAEGRVAPLNRALVRGFRDLPEGLADQPSTRAGGRLYGVPQSRSATLLAWRNDRIPGTLTKSDAVFERPQLVPYRGLVTAAAGPG